MIKKRFGNTYGRQFKPRAYSYKELGYLPRGEAKCRVKKNYHYVVFNSGSETIVFHSKYESSCFKWLHNNPQSACRVLRWYSETDLFEGLEEAVVD